MLRVREIAERLDVTEHTVLAWIQNGELLAMDVSRNRGGKPSWRISPESLEAFEQSRMPMPPIAKSQVRRRNTSQPGVVEFY